MAANTTDFLNTSSELASVWAAFVQLSKEGKLWGDSGNARNAIIDAETLLCLLLPEAYVAQLRTRNRGSGSIAAPSEDIASILAVLDPSIKRFEARGSRTPQLPDGSTDQILDLLLDYFNRYDADGIPSFSAGSYLSVERKDSHEADANIDNVDMRSAAEVVDVYTYSLTLSLLVLLLLERWSLERADAQQKVTRLRGLAHARLTGAMASLVNSFSVNRNISRTSWQSKTNREWPGTECAPLQEVWDYLNRQPGERMPPLNDAAFEVGWSWGPLRPEDRFGGGSKVARVAEGRYYAVNAPYLYFTVGAIDGIRDLFSPEAQSSNLLTDDQLYLAATLRTYLDLATKYWTGLCLHGAGKLWPIEDIPWSTADGDLNDYWTLYLLRIVLPESETSEHSAARFISLVRELAQRARIIRKPVPEDRDEALGRHDPGTSLKLELADSTGLQAVALSWQIYDFSPQLLKAAGQLLAVTREPWDRTTLTNLTYTIWDHMARRRQKAPPLWDNLEAVYPLWRSERISANPDARVNSWYVTERTVEALVAVAQGELLRPTDPSSAALFLNELIAHLDWRYATEDRSSDANHHDIRQNRGAVHKARGELSQGNVGEALKTLFGLLSRS